MCAAQDKNSKSMENDCEASSHKLESVAENNSPFKVPLPTRKLQKLDKVTELQSSHVSENVLSHADKSAEHEVNIDPETSKRSAISFKTKSMMLPANVYKPHQPSAEEFLQRELKQHSNKTHSSDLKQYEDAFTSDSTLEIRNKPVSTEKVDEFSTAKISTRNQKQRKDPPLKFQYEKPEWSSSCDVHGKEYFLEVLKLGAIIDKIDLMKKEFVVFGRLSDCDVVLEHPSISRYHALLQFGTPTQEYDNVEFQKDGSAGFYLYELGSTHGTFLNKARVPEKRYYRLKVGHMIKFGNSTRIYILQGPDDDQEAEAEETPTELRDKMRKERSKKELQKLMMGDDSDSDIEEEKNTPSYKSTSAEDPGITWGMLEDAVMEEVEEEKQDSQPDAVMFEQKKDPFYVKDPGKALKNFFEKEGMELDFECTEKRPGQWNARLELPVDSPTGHAVYAEACVTGKKKDAINNCALEACRVLDKHGMFKQSERHQRKVKQWEKDDYYDSDEDQFLDRTGELEAKRRQRKLRVDGKKALQQEKAATYESLTKRLHELDKEVIEIELQLNKDKEAIRTKEGVEDPLEEFMKQVKAGSTLDSITRSKMKRRLIEARKELSRLAKLAEIARPASMPPVTSAAQKSVSFIGKMKGKKKISFASNKPIPTPTVTTMNTNDNEVEIEEEDDEQRSSALATTDKTSDVTSGPGQQEKDDARVSRTRNTENGDPPHSSTAALPAPDISPPDPDSQTSSRPSNQSSRSDDEVTKPSTRNRRKFGPTLPDELRARLTGETENVAEDSTGSMERSEDNEDKPTKRRKRNRKRDHPSKPAPAAAVSNDPDFCDWMPPQGQSGDGMTALNAKYGY